MNTYQQALVEERKGSFEDALALFEQSRSDDDVDEGDVLFHCGWCIENQERGDTERALQYYLEASRLTHSHPCKINSLFRSGWLLMHKQENAKAALMFREAIDYGDIVDLKIEPYKDSVYWYAICLESQGLYLEAVQWYRLIENLSPGMKPESNWRQVNCLTRVGSFHKAKDLCSVIEASPPEGFSTERYAMLRSLAVREREMLAETMSDSYNPPPAKYRHL